MCGSRKAIEPSTAKRRFALAAVLGTGLLLSACVGGGDSAPRRISHRPAAKPAPKRAALPPAYRAGSSEYRQCTVRLASLNASYTPLPDRSYGGGCSAYGAVRLLDVGVPLTNAGAMTCPLAETFAAWARYGVEPAARLILGSPLVRIETMGTYNCRTVAGSAKLSEHSHSNAVDVAAFVLADGRRITIEDDWNGTRSSKEFLRRIRESACKRFRTVLSPDYNAAHYNHLHFDMGGKGNYCR